jgi:hypothetical protein
VFRVTPDRHFPARQTWVVIWQVVVGDADAGGHARDRLPHNELVEMAILPTHRVLNGDVQIPLVDAHPYFGFNISV